MSAAWAQSEGSSRSSVARHEWKGLNKMRGRLEDFLEKQRAEEQDSSRLRRSLRLRAQQQLPGGYDDAYDD